MREVAAFLVAAGLVLGAWALDLRARAPCGSPATGAVARVEAARADPAALALLVDSLTRAVADDPADTSARFALAWALHLLGRTAEALPHYQHATQSLGALLSPAQYNLALLHADAGRPDLARPHVDALAARDPGFPGALALQRRVHGSP